MTWLLANLETILLAIFGVSALVGGMLVIVLRQPMRVAMALVSTMIFLGGIYGLLGVHFIAAFQVLIYVGAVMVFMVYVIMLLEVREAPGSRRYSRFVIPGVIAFTLLMGVLGISVWKAFGSGPVADLPAGTVFGMGQFSTLFLRDYWLPFELTTVLLIAAIVAALAVIKVSRRTHG
jgi:NADH-quinone oxidoreductase subunit J